MILGIDPGTHRVGVAIAELETRFARPVETVEAASAIARIVELVTDFDVETVVVGRPVSLSGEAGPAVDSYAGFLAELRASLPQGIPVVEHDERLTSVIAQQELRQAGVSSKKSRAMIDAVAAQVMLQSYLDASRNGA